MDFYEITLERPEGEEQIIVVGTVRVMGDTSTVFRKKVDEVRVEDAPLEISEGSMVTFDRDVTGTLDIKITDGFHTSEYEVVAKITLTEETELPIIPVEQV